jgi:hypothetical protein
MMVMMMAITPSLNASNLFLFIIASIMMKEISALQKRLLTPAAREYHQEVG